MNRNTVRIFLTQPDCPFNPRAKENKTTYKRIYDFIMKETDYLPTKASLTERIYNMTAEIDELQVCSKCGTNMKFRSAKAGYSCNAKKCKK